MKKWNQLSQYLKARSKEICKANGCTKEDHNCESYAYINKAGDLLDVCASDFFQGYGGEYAAVCLPWTGTGAGLKEEVLNQCEEMEG